MGHVQVVNLLLQSGADVNKAAKEGQTPLFTGCRQWSQGSGGDAPRGWLRQDGGNLGGTHCTVESTGAQPPRGRRPPAVNGRPLFFFYRTWASAPK